MMKKILCVVLMGILGLSGSLWAVDTPKREKPSFNFSANEEEGAEIEIETKNEPAEEGTDVAVADLPAVYYQEEDGSIYLNLEGIPGEVWMAILGFLDLSDLGWFAQVSHFFYRLIQDEAVLGPIEVWPHYAGLSRFPDNDNRGVLNVHNRLNEVISLCFGNLSDEHAVYLLKRLVEWGARIRVWDKDVMECPNPDLALKNVISTAKRLRDECVAIHRDRGMFLEAAPDLAPVPRVEEVDVARDGNAIDVGAFYNNGLGLTREQLLAYLVFLGALTTYSTGCNLL